LKSIIVTGGSSGIGKAAVIRLVQSGYQVFGLSRRYDQLLALSSELSSYKLKDDQYFPVIFDITRYDKFEEVLNNILSNSSEKTIFGLVNNAGYVEPGAIEDITIENLRAQFETNFFGLVEFTKEVLPLMMQRKEGRIINVSSLSGLISLPLIGAYSATKHALEAISDALRMELWNTNIKVININPGVVETDIYRVIRLKLAIIEKEKKSRFSNAYNKYLNNIPSGLSAKIVANVIDQAIRSSTPKHRYIIGSSKEKLALRLRPFIPNKLFYSQVAKRILS
jgi:short-subunit dehydrogenase